MPKHCSIFAYEAHFFLQHSTENGVRRFGLCLADVHSVLARTREVWGDGTVSTERSVYVRPLCRAWTLEAGKRGGDFSLPSPNTQVSLQPTNRRPKEHGRRKCNVADASDQEYTPVDFNSKDRSRQQQPQKANVGSERASTDEGIDRLMKIPKIRGHHTLYTFAKYT